MCEDENKHKSESNTSSSDCWQQERTTEIARIGHINALWQRHWGRCVAADETDSRSRAYTLTLSNRYTSEIRPNLEGRRSQATQSSYSFTKDTSETTQPNKLLHTLSRNLASTFTLPPYPETLIDHARAALCALQSTHVLSGFSSKKGEEGNHNHLVTRFSSQSRFDFVEF